MFINQVLLLPLLTILINIKNSCAHAFFYTYTKVRLQEGTKIREKESSQDIFLVLPPSSLLSYVLGLVVSLTNKGRAEHPHPHKPWGLQALHLRRVVVVVAQVIILGIGRI